MKKSSLKSIEIVRESYSLKNGKKGITLVALVVTIIVLLILAGMTISQLTGNGLFEKAKLAADESKYQTAKEKVQIAVNMSFDKSGKLNSDILKEKLNKIIGINPEVTEIKYDLLINVDGYAFTISENGKVNSSKLENEEAEQVIANGTTYKFNYTGDVQEFIVQETGYYTIECWGASGGNSLVSGSVGSYGGNGGYTKGTIYLEKGEKLYIYVGSQGADAAKEINSAQGYNGGGIGTWDNSDDEAAGAGGGATDIRLVSGEWNNFESLKSRIMVAAGGGGSSWETKGGEAGGLEGNTYRTKSVPGTQTSGYKFGIGQDGYGTGSSDGVAGAGGGYYGGTTSDYADGDEAGAGGSSFISGYEGCNAISKDSTEDNIIHTDQPNHYSGKIFINAYMLAGNKEMLSIDKTQKVTGNKGDGYTEIIFEGKEFFEHIYTYTGDMQEFVVEKTGYYTIECLGATGGKSLVEGSTYSYGGSGGYTKGTIHLQKGEKLYIYVGGKGADAAKGINSEQGYNGGGLGTWDNSDNEAAGAGGGATDIRLVSGEWNNFESLKSRIMVAAGGGGSSWKTKGGEGGALEGNTYRPIAVPGTQTSGYKFGIGQDGYGTGRSDGVAGAGGGYYGGTTTDYDDGTAEAAAGGSSFISGHEGCNAISKDSIEDNIIHTNQPNHYSGKIFTDTTMISGKDIASSILSTEIPFEINGNGFVKIVYKK